MTRSIYSLWPWTPTGGSTTPPADTEPDQPVGLTATASGTTTINLSWTADSTAAPNQATYYTVEWSNDGLGSWSTIASPTSNSYSDTSLSPSQTRYYRISSCNAVGCSLASVTANATTQSGALTPAWSIDWSSGTPSGYTVTRASSGTYVDSSGYVASASTDVARLTHNSSGNRLGLLVEEQRANTSQYSEDPANAYYTKTNSSIDNNGGAFWTSPANASDAVLLTQNTTTGVHSINRAFSGTDCCFSVFLKKQTTSGVGRYATLIFRRASTDYYHATFDLDQGTTTQSAVVGGNVTSTDRGIEAYANGWYRCWVRGTQASATQAFHVALATTGTPTMTSNGESFTGANTTDGVYIWGLMREANNTPPTSYIETPSNASVTRSADLAHVLDSSITSWGDPGALVIHFYPPGQAGTLISTDDASTAQLGIEASSTTAARAFWSSGSTSTGTIGSSGVQKAVHYWNGSTSKFCIGGGTVQSGTNNLTISNTDFVTLGAEATDSSGVPGTFSQYANCVIRKVEFYSGTLTDANLQTITT